MGELAQLAERVLDVAAQLFDHRLDRVGVGLHQLAGQAELHRQRDEVLLRAVVQVPFDARRDSSAAVTMRNREAWSSSLRCCSSRGCLQRGVESDVVQREANLARELGEHALRLVGERHGVRLSARRR